MTFSPAQEKGLLALAAFGFVVPNGLFVHQALTNPDALRAALANPIALTFIIEAFLLTGFFAWMIRRDGLRRPGWAAFVVMSLVGSLAFSVPAFLYLTHRRRRSV